MLYLYVKVIFSFSSTTRCNRIPKQNPEKPTNEKACQPVNFHSNNSQQN